MAKNYDKEEHEAVTKMIKKRTTEGRPVRGGDDYNETVRAEKRRVRAQAGEKTAGGDRLRDAEDKAMKNYEKTGYVPGGH